ncbi:MaoC/PaaZ C-terminal domain-containing protein [Microbacterium sp. ASV49]|uniref:MaoC/PaaZ C-terminal domain-containing protein n=1 Tax=Microbacterium candidum TaxID=3041922 RepID=A0ABT7N3Q0_9MICO|nr:MaoC/PaaZ C-terminal domain-containing protein [Microbacterium sp. ASV49]MDL9981311.1 MaoC/PaaZ C-terminal domain-containing protein [Microbacterium sp. ASV49]
MSASTGSATISVGDVVAERTVHLTRESLVRYAGASGDFNQIHWSDVVAERVGLPGVLAHGMLTMGLAVTTLDTWVGDPRRVLEYGVRFTKPVLVDQETGADVQVVARVGAVSDDEARIDLTVTSADQTVLGKAQVRVAHA